MTKRFRIDPQFALAYNNRGDAWRGKGDMERAGASAPTLILSISGQFCSSISRQFGAETTAT